MHIVVDRMDVLAYLIIFRLATLSALVSIDIIGASVHRE